MAQYDPLTDQSAYGQAALSSDPWRAAITKADDGYGTRRRRRLALGVIGIVGFLLLLLGAHFVGGFQKPMQAAALVWFLVFGVVRAGFDLTRL